MYRATKLDVFMASTRDGHIYLKLSLPTSTTGTQTTISSPDLCCLWHNLILSHTGVLVHSSKNLIPLPLINKPWRNLNTVCSSPQGRIVCFQQLPKKMIVSVGLFCNVGISPIILYIFLYHHHQQPPPLLIEIMSLVEKKIKVDIYLATQNEGLMRFNNK